MSFADSTIHQYLDALASRQPYPGGGAAAAISAAHACALAEMSAHYTTGKKWADRSDTVNTLLSQLRDSRQQLLSLADQDAAAYTDLQRSWQDAQMPAEEKNAIEQRALSIPCEILTLCSALSISMMAFLEHCNPMIISDAQAAIHLFSGAAHAAYHTAVINKPSPAVHNELQDQLALITQTVQAALRR